MTAHELVHQEMTHRAVYVQPEEDLYQAYSLMRRAGIRHLPVVEGVELVGILSDRDIFRHGNLRDGVLTVGNCRVDEAMTRGVQTCRPGDRLGDVTDVMLRCAIDALPVVDDQGALLGIITSTDLLRRLRRLEGLLDPGALMEQRIMRYEP